jgi:O-antigen/teichoic acid export membrane protein
MYIFFLGIDITKNTRLISKINLSMGVLGAVLSIALVPVFGVWGAIGSATVAAVLRLVLYIYFSQRLYRLQISLVTPFSIIAGLTAFNVARLL